MSGALLQILDPFGVGDRVESVNWQGDLLVLLNASSYAAYLVLVKPLMSKYHPLTVVRYTFTIGLVMVIPFGLNELTEAQWGQLDWSIGWRLIFVVMGTTVMAYLLNAWSLKHVNSSVVGAYIYLQPRFCGRYSHWVSRL